jgi:hypothetical protein
MQIAIAGSEAQRPFGDPPRNLKNQRSDVVSCPKTRKKKIALSYIVFAIVAASKPHRDLKTAPLPHSLTVASKPHRDLKTAPRPHSLTAALKAHRGLKPAPRPQNLTGTSKPHRDLKTSPGPQGRGSQSIHHREHHPLHRPPKRQIDLNCNALLGEPCAQAQVYSPKAASHVAVVRNG